MTKQEILEDLRGLFRRKTMLSPSDIADVIAQSPRSSRDTVVVK